MRRFAVVVPLLLSMSACNTVYQRASSPQTASIRFLASQYKGYYSTMNVYAHNNEKCGTPKKIVGIGGGIFNMGGASEKNADIGMSKDPSGQYAAGQYFETTVDAGSRFHFTVTGGERNSICYVSSSFLPEPQAEYEVTYSTDMTYCYVSIERISPVGTTFERAPEPSSEQRPKACSFFWN